MSGLYTSSLSFKFDQSIEGHLGVPVDEIARLVLRRAEKEARLFLARGRVLSTGEVDSDALPDKVASGIRPGFSGTSLARGLES